MEPRSATEAEVGAPRLRRTNSCPSCSNEILEGARTCPTCGALLQLEVALRDLKTASLRKAWPGFGAIRSDPVPILVWFLSVIPLLVVSPILAVAIAAYAGEPQGEQRRWVYTLALVNILVSLLFWWWAGNQIADHLGSFMNWLQSVPNSKGSGLSI
ncbi:zinc-ribbon domain-containing protein [Kaistia dalseonensis]|uniref:zinc-ribbon domain-containing protein n=1 Tax=Kaistia dalseonensis TaxID=410840 RepID=UPI003521849B